VIGSQATDGDLAALREQLMGDPRGFVAQREVKLSMVPTLVGDRLVPRHVDLRPFAVNDGHKVWVLPGGLTRVALPEGELIVNSSRGGGSKDTWVLAGPGAAPRRREPTASGPREIAPLDGGPAADPRARQAEQQQQARDHRTDVDPC